MDLTNLGLEKWVFILRVFLKFLILYIQVGFGSNITKTRTQPKPALGFILKTQTQPYCFVGRVKPALLGLGQAKYPRVGYFLPSLHKTLRPTN